jgi:broad specificity phosphatase PhoE
MAKLYYFTHPASQINFHIPPQHWGLSEKGFAELEVLMKMDHWQSIEVVYSSAEPKSIIVAERAAREHNIDHFLEKRLGEADRSQAKVIPADQYMAKIKEAYANPHERINNWESHHSMRERNIAAVEEIITSHKGKDIAIIGHGGAGTCIKCHFKDVDLSFAEDPQKTGCYFVVDLETHNLLQDWESYS